MAVQPTKTKETIAQSSQTTIMIVDDEKIIRELCEQALRKYRVVQAGSCDEALRLYEKEPVDLILSDVMMPGESGIELLKKVKIIDPNATVVIMTGFVDKDVILSALKADADDFINKPLNLLQLKTTVEKVLERKTIKEDLASIKRSDALKNTFLSLISHKLRTPITGISLFLQNLRMGVINAEDPIFLESINLATREARYLGQLVSDLLAFSKIMETTADVKKYPTDLNEIVADVLIKCREEHCSFDVELEASPEPLPPIYLDAAKIRFALYQVIDNAFKFSGDYGDVSIKIGSHSDMAFIIVSDTGIGIPETELPKIFEKFYQIDQDNTGQVRGFGLGLFYAQDFVRQHGGSINLASEPGLGTTVTITLPLQ
jgi:signal transduction histidine kinase